MNKKQSDSTDIDIKEHSMQMERRKTAMKNAIMKKMEQAIVD